MPLIATHELRAGAPIPHQEQVYNGLDTCITHEVLRELRTLGTPPEVYDFERALQAPALEMMLRGFRIDGYERDKSREAIRRAIAHLDEILQEFAAAVWDHHTKNTRARETLGLPAPSLNPASRTQLIAFFCGAMQLPERWTSKKGVRKQSMDRETLEHYEVYLHARPIIACVLGIRELAKVLDTLQTEIDEDTPGNLRFRTSINIAGTDTGRFSTSTSVFGTGSNIQNIKRDDDIFDERWMERGAIPPHVVSLRRMFIADRGMKLGGIDLEQTESRDVGWQCGVLFGDWKYLDVHDEGDLHTTTARLIWPELPWTGKMRCKPECVSDSCCDRAIAERIFYRHYTYRDMSKKGGHGSNYLGTPFTMGRHLKVPTRLMEMFQERYFDTFEAIPRYQRWVAQELQTTQQLVTPFGRTRHFFGRPRDDTTLRKAIAFIPQSTTADRMNLGLYRIWRDLRRDAEVQLLAQVHDAVYFQYPDSADEAAIIRECLARVVDIPLHDARSGRTMRVPGEAKVGWNWGLYHARWNPNGMRKLAPEGDTRRRLDGMERVL